MNKSIQKNTVYFNLKTSFVFALFVLLFNINGCKPKEANQKIEMSVSKSDSVFFPKSGIKIFLLATAWGIAGNSEQTLIVRNRSIDTIKLFTSEIFYKKVGDDSLVIYAEGGSIPSNINGNFKGVNVLVMSLNSYDTLSRYRANYSNYGLSKLSAIK